MTNLCDVHHEQAIGGKFVWVNGAAHHSHWADRLTLEVYIHPEGKHHRHLGINDIYTFTFIALTVKIVACLSVSAWMSSVKASQYFN